MEPIQTICCEVDAMITFNKKIILLKCPQQNGRLPRTEEARAVVRGHADKPGLSLVIETEQAGWQAELIVSIWRRDYEKDSFTHAIVDGTTYRIKRATAGDRQMIVRLLLTRG